MATVFTRRNVLLQSGCGLAAAALAGCTVAPDRDHVGSEAPQARPLTGLSGVAWVFSSGGPRGFVHIGVVQALDELGLKPDFIVGASAGALVGVLCASGMNGLQLRELALNLQPLTLARISVGSNERFSALGIADWLRERVDGRPLQALKLPVACVAYRPRLQDVVAFTAGDAGVAVAASCAIEGQFAPVRIRGDQYVDADRFQPLPVRVAFALGATQVIAVDASVHLDRAPPGAERYREVDLRKWEMTQADAKLARLVVKPDFGYWVNLSRDFRERAMTAGYRDTLSQAEELRALYRESQSVQGVAGTT